MKIMTSYFYQIRNFSKNMIPVSTARWDPLWYHQGTKDYGRIFKDKRGIYNGIRGEIFHFNGDHCDCGPHCKSKDPNTCDFLKEYRAQLNGLDFDWMISELERIANNIQVLEEFDEEPIVVLIVYETPNNYCSERVVLHQWFADNGYPIEEWYKS